MNASNTAIQAVPISGQLFSPFGDLIELGRVEPVEINDGRCLRYTDLAEIDILDGEPGISLFHADIRKSPYMLTLLERHPLGSQAFLPLQGGSYLAIVAEDDNGTPVKLKAFLVAGDQGINIHRNVWHGVLTPLSGNGLFAVVDRIGNGSNLEEHRFDEPIKIQTGKR